MRPLGHSDESNETPKRPQKAVGKKGRSVKRNAEGWAKNVAKKKRNLGLSYVSYASKIEMKGLKKIGPQCKDGCFERVTMGKVKDILDGYWALGDINKQNAYIYGCISEESFIRKYTKKEKSQRSVKTVFTVMHSGVYYKVCRKGFAAMHGVSRDRVESIAKKKRASPTGIPPIDRRGYRPNERKIVGPKADFMHQHIQSLPVTTSLCSRIRNPNRQYLVAVDEARSVPKLYCNYLSWMELQHPGVPTVTESYYRHIFTTQYNITFQPPKKDVCNTCTQSNIKIADLKSKGLDYLSEEKLLNLHKEKAQDARALLRTHEKTKVRGVRAIAVDLQQALPYPKLSANKVYYLRKLWLYNFCLYDCETNVSHMFLWDETQGGRGAVEIGSCILQWLEEVNDEPFHTLRIFADNCGGQNKNIHIILMLLKQVHKMRLMYVDVIFMVSGHSYLPCDRSFEVLEKAFRQRAEIETPDQYAFIIESAMGNGQVKVHRMDKTHFKDIKVLSDVITRRTISREFKNASQIVLSIEEPSSYRLKSHYHFDDSPTDVVVTLEKAHFPNGRGRGMPKKTNLNLSYDAFPQKYLTDRALQPAKVKDLRSLLAFMYMPNRHFLENVIQKQEALASSGSSRGRQQPDDDDSDDENDATTWEEDYEPVRRLTF